MDDLTTDDEKKPLDALVGQNDEDSQPHHARVRSRRTLACQGTPLRPSRLSPTTHRALLDSQVPDGAVIQVRCRRYAARQNPDIRRPGADPRIIVVLVPSEDGLRA